MRSAESRRCSLGASVAKQDEAMKRLLDRKRARDNAAKKTKTMAGQTSGPDAYDLTEDLLDAIADEKRLHEAKMDEHLREVRACTDAGNREEAGRASTQAEHHLTAVAALNSALARCQRIKDSAFKTGGGHE